MEQIFEKIINNALFQEATDIHMIIKKECSISFRVFGRLKVYARFSKSEGTKLINYLRFLSNIDMNYRLKPQTGHLNYRFKSHTYYLRVSSLAGKDMDSLVVRILNNHQEITISEITPFKDTREFLTIISNKRAGLFVISGATGSGKSTSLYAMLDSIYQSSNRNIVTLEDPIEIKKEHCLQIQINEKLGITYEKALRQVLRHDPDVIMIGEIRDSETAKLAITCALTGHLVLTTVHASNCISTIKRLMNLDIAALDLQEVLLGVLNQTMLYNNKQKGPIILSEFITKQQLQTYFEVGEVEYINYSNHAKVLVDNNMVSIDEVGDFLNEK